MKRTRVWVYTNSIHPSSCSLIVSIACGCGGFHLRYLIITSDARCDPYGRALS